MATKREYRTRNPFLAAHIMLTLDVDNDWYIASDSKVFFVFPPVEGLRAAIREFKDAKVDAYMYAFQVDWLLKMRQKLMNVWKRRFGGNDI